MKAWMGPFLFFSILGASLSSASNANGEAFTERDVKLDTKTGTLWGTLTSPSANPSGPVALIIPGSGPTDRDGNGPTIHPDTLKLLAHGLAEQGIGSVRIDKRGIGESRAAMTSEADLRFETYANDVHDWVALVRDLTHQDCVWLIGHSEGALVAEVAAQDTNGVCGLVLISGAGRKAGDVLREQLTARLSDPLKTEALNTIAELEAGRTIPNPPAELAALFRPSVQPYLISWLPLDPAQILATLKLPVLIVQGTSDLQVSVADARRLAAARPDARLVIMPDVNHVLKIAALAHPGENIATYSLPALPLAPGLVDTIAQFMTENMGHAARIGTASACDQHAEGLPTFENGLLG
jgi:pimeloyl-ACP methyl ester carboxylesterase